MAWLYNQKSGKMIGPNGEEFEGYSGAGVHKNEPRSEAILFEGPIPRGSWRIDLSPYDSANVGRYALKLSPVGHSAHRRTDFRIHGDSIADPGTASRGCIILNIEQRKAIVRSGDSSLIVR